MKTLIAGASGATGRLLVYELLRRGQEVTAIVRSSNSMPSDLKEHQNLTLVEASILNISDEDMSELVRDCGAVASCLGHNLTFKGVFGQPRRLVTEATRKLCKAIQVNAREHPAKFVLMNTTGNRNHDLSEQISFAQKCVIRVIRLCIPPHADNEDAAEHLRVNIGQNKTGIEWAVVRPDGLINEDSVSDYDLHASPTRSAIFNAGKTSRINVSHFIAELISSSDLWNQWKGQMPVIYNKAQPGETPNT